MSRSHLIIDSQAVALLGHAAKSLVVKEISCLPKKRNSEPWVVQVESLVSLFQGQANMLRPGAGAWKSASLCCISCRASNDRGACYVVGVPLVMGFLKTESNSTVWHPPTAIVKHFFALGTAPVASSEARDVPHQAMNSTLYRRFQMVIKIANNFPAFFSLFILIGPTSKAKEHDHDMIILK
jgi:hypothetical protein